MSSVLDILGSSSELLSSSSPESLSESDEPESLGACTGTGTEGVFLVWLVLLVSSSSEVLSSEDELLLLLDGNCAGLTWATFLVSPSELLSSSLEDLVSACTGFLSTSALEGVFF